MQRNSRKYLQELGQRWLKFGELNKSLPIVFKILGWRNWQTRAVVYRVPVETF